MRERQAERKKETLHNNHVDKQKRKKKKKKKKRLSNTYKTEFD
jgi:hypothetical protein